MGLLDELRRYVRVYLANVSQVGVLAPTSTVVLDTIGGVTWVYIGPGVYELHSGGRFTVDYTSVLFGVSSSFNAAGALLSWLPVDESILQFEVSVGGLDTDGLMNYETICVVVAQ